MNQSIKWNSLLVLILYVLITGCRKPESKINIDVSGTWNWSYEDVQKSYMNKTFELTLSQNGSIIEGKYCAIAKNNKILDCYDNNNIKGSIQRDTAYLNFKGFYDVNSFGKAIIYKNKDKLIWKITSKKGDVYAPEYAELNYGKLESEIVSIEKANKVSNCKYGNGCSCKENDSQKSIYEDSLIITCSFEGNSIKEVYSLVYNSEKDLQKYLMPELPKESFIYSTNDNSFNTEYKLKEDSLSVYISQENGGFEFIFKLKDDKVVLEKHAYPG